MQQNMVWEGQWLAGCTGSFLFRPVNADYMPSAQLEKTDQVQPLCILNSFFYAYYASIGSQM